MVWKIVKKYFPLLFILTLLFLFYLLDFNRFFSFNYLKEQRMELLSWVEKYPIRAPMLYMLTYAFLTAISFPGGAFFTIFGGFLFGQPFSTLYVVIGATIGACTIFLAAQTAFRDLFRQFVLPYLGRMEKELSTNAVSYLFFLRLVPLFPFWIVNIAPAFFDIPLRTFFITTFFGIIPGTFVFTQAGVGLGAILDQGERFSLQAILNPQVKIALFALGVFALIPILLRKLKLSKEKDSAHKE